MMISMDLWLGGLLVDVVVFVVGAEEETRSYWLVIEENNTVVGVKDDDVDNVGVVFVCSVTFVTISVVAEDATMLVVVGVVSVLFSVALAAEDAGERLINMNEVRSRMALVLMVIMKFFIQSSEIG